MKAPKIDMTKWWWNNFPRMDIGFYWKPTDRDAPTRAKIVRSMRAKGFCKRTAKNAAHGTHRAGKNQMVNA